MLSCIGRAAIRRGGAGARASQISTNRVLENIWLLQRTAGAEDSHAQSQLSLLSLRSFATATNSPPKTAPKSKKSKTIVTKAKDKNAAKKPTKKPTKKPSKKKPVKRVAIKKLAPKKKPAKVLTDAQKLKAEVKALKIIALSPPLKKAASIFQQILVEHTQGISSRATETSSVAAAKYKSLSPAELESYNQIIHANKAENEIALKKWVESHTPDQIRLANNARKLLKRRGIKSHTSPIPDTRIPKPPGNAYSAFISERQTSGDFQGIKVPDRGPLLGKEWRELTSEQRKKYEDIAYSSSQRYNQEFKTVFGRDRPVVLEKTRDLL